MRDDIPYGKEPTIKSLVDNGYVRVIAVLSMAVPLAITCGGGFYA